MNFHIESFLVIDIPGLQQGGVLIIDLLALLRALNLILGRLHLARLEAFVVALGELEVDLHAFLPL